MNISCYLYKGMIYVPTSYEIERGFYYEHLPIDVVPVDQTEKLRDAFRAAIARGNPPISRDEVAAVRSRGKDRPMLIAAGARSWRDFERRLSGSWSIVKNGSYKIGIYRPRPDSGWHEGSSIKFPPETPIDDVIARLIDLMQEKV